MRFCVKSSKVTAAETDDQKDERFDDYMKMVKDDFDYLVDTFDKLDRDGETEKAINLMMQAHNQVNQLILQSIAEVEA